MMIAWRRLNEVPLDDPRPWLIGTARNLVLTDWRRQRLTVEFSRGERPEAGRVGSPLVELDPALEAAFLELSPSDREALLLVAWEDLTPKAAAASLGISSPAFRVRLHRARRRLIARLADHEPPSAVRSTTRLEET